MTQTPRLPNELLGRFTVDEITAVIDYCLAVIDQQAPERRAELRQHAARALRRSPKMKRF